MHNSESFSSLTVEVGGPTWETQDDGIPLDTYSSPSPSLSSSSTSSIPSFPPSNTPYHPHSTNNSHNNIHITQRPEIPLSLPQLFKKYAKDCTRVIGIDTFIAMICFVSAAPYMIWAAYAGNYASLIKGIKYAPPWMDYLERTDTLIIGVCLLYFILVIN